VYKGIIDPQLSCILVKRPTMNPIPFPHFIPEIVQRPVKWHSLNAYR
jgi:hypothetical protein